MARQHSLFRIVAFAGDVLIAIAPIGRALRAARSRSEIPASAFII